MSRYAAIDIGSNSVRMLAAEVDSKGAMQTLASDRQVTRLGDTVFRDGKISNGALDQLCAVLARMREAIGKLDIAAMRAVATSAVRDTSNQAQFLERASFAIGAPIEVISGLEEARLIHFGVTARWPHPHHRVLIIDVGGGSAEIILSEHGVRKEAFSKPLGAVRLYEVFLKNDPPEPVELYRMEQYIQEKIAPCLAKIGLRKFDRVIGTSATAAALVSAVHRIPSMRRDEADRRKATAQQVRHLYAGLCKRNLAGRRKLPGIGPRRAEIIIPGAAVFVKAMEAFHLPAVHYTDAGVKDGIVADLAARGVGRERALLDRDQRRVVEQMARKYGVEVPHARHVALLAHRLFETLQPIHKLPPECGRLLQAAAYLHDTGHFISDSAHHKHSAYIVANSGMPGFTDVERRLIGMLCRFHRKSMPSMRHETFHSMPPEQRHRTLVLLPLLRLADSLDRSHSQHIDHLDCDVSSNSVELQVRSKGGADLDLWAAERVAEIFRQIYGKTLQLVNIRS
ncbi:MAG TPA: Ppx/GppA phosphatase family protein [Bryobacteraceae bacterium]|nr:Ppx/GppA phosphatase family protein [Bryobacteraceae bacterium]